MQTHTNRLAGETSPYLLQHAHNPVDWYPWGEEALARAQAEDKPIFLSIGYSACHWCHVMEHESFEDPEIAALMNEHFVSIKVDREERPDLDGIYMQAVQTISGQGGWPMSVFLTPEGAPFWGGTYFPPQDRQGMPSFRRVLLTMHDVWVNRRAEVLANGQELSKQLSQLAIAGGSLEALGAETLTTAADDLLRYYDEANGGFGRAPKFPQPMTIDFLYRQWYRTPESTYRTVADHVLESMARGGVYDQLGGGFHRYSVDAQWSVPHFEKMLYDNAQLARAYVTGYMASGNPFFRRIAEETLEYVARDMQDPSGGFYSTEDADSEGEEGKFYVWTLRDVQSALGPDDAAVFAAYYGVTEHGNFEHSGATVLHVADSIANVAAKLGMDEARAIATLDRARRALFELREQRVRPARDEKIVTAWNGMMLRAFAEAARVLDRADFLDVAVRNATFLLAEMRSDDGHVLRTWKPGHSAKLNGYLEDYANLADGLIALYEATFDDRWLAAAIETADAILAHFADAERGGFYDTSDDHESLITRPRDMADNATPSGNAVAADVLLRLALFTGNQVYQEHARLVLQSVGELIRRYPLGVARSLCALDFLLGRPKEIVLIGDRSDPASHALARTVFETYLPNRVVAGAADPSQPTHAAPLLEGREARGGRPTAYVCEHYTCLAPTTEPEELKAQLVGS